MEALKDTDPTHIGAHALLARLGAGGMGQVYLARSPGGRLVAVKVIRDEITGHPDALARFRREAETVRAVRSAYTANLIDASLAAPPYWLATEYVAGPTLSHAVARQGALPADTCRRLFAALAEGLASVHEYGVTHRDLKPQNVILGAQGPQLIDFGIAKDTAQTALTQDGLAPGTPGYTAPEVLLRNETGDPADVFALGATIAYAATGRAPYGTGEAATVSFRAVHGEIDVAGVEPTLAALIEACVAKEPADRPTPAEVIRRCAVDSALVDDPVYAGLAATGEAPQIPALPTTAGASPAGMATPVAGAPAPPGYTPTYMPTYGPGAPHPNAPTYVPLPPTAPPAAPKPRLSRAAILGIALLFVVPGAVGGYLAMQDKDDAKGGAKGTTQAQGGPTGAAQPGPTGSASAQPKESATGTGGIPGHIEATNPNRDWWTGGAPGTGCSFPAEEKQEYLQTSVTDARGGANYPFTGKMKVNVRLKFPELVPAPYVISVTVKSPHDTGVDGEPLGSDNKSIGFASKPVSLHAGDAESGVTLTYPDDFSTHVTTPSGAKVYPAVPLAKDPGNWTVLVLHVRGEKEYASIYCTGFQAQ
ncbi:serine/threonine-protein kinase [Streptomyces sp. NPDC048603]|uniref:serine/threonine-protein kinase n=1 Tax=Streptomyces sp. NPDC048603 TaxID=3365577 RepID=UPI003724B370